MLNLTVTEAGLQDAHTLESNYELMDVVAECLEEGMKDVEASLVLQRCIAVKLTEQEACFLIPDSDLDQFVKANQAAFDSVLAGFHRDMTEVYDLAHALYLEDHGAVGTA